MPLRVLLLAGIVVLGAAALVSWLRSPASTDAHIVAAEYSMEVDVAPTQVALGDTFVAKVGILHNEPGGFSGMQWRFDYDASVVSVESIGQAPGAPDGCVLSNYDSERVLLACVSFIPNGLTYSGHAFEVVFKCNAEAITTLDMRTDTQPGSIVQRADSTLLPVHAHDDVINCTSAAPPNTPGPTPTTTDPVTGPRGGQWPLLVSPPQDAVVGETFRVDLSIVPPDSLGYRSVDFWVAFDESALSRVSVQKNDGAPPDCIPFLSQATPFLTSCTKYGMNELSHSGVAFNVDFQCLEVGPTQISVLSGPNGPQSTVYTGSDPNVFLEEVVTNAININCLPPLLFNGLAKAIDGELPEDGDDTTLRNLWICYDQATDGIDNDGDSTIDEEPATCGANGEGELLVEEWVAAHRDCDTRNDDDDGDGRPLDGSAADGSNTPYVGSNPRPECRQPTLEDFIQDNVDKDGGEEPEGLGAIEFQLKFDHKIFDITVTESDDESDAIDNDGDTLVDENDEDWANNRFANCSMMIISENDIRFGCVTSGPGPGHFRPNGIPVASIRIVPEADLRFRIRPGKDNGVVRRILQENCEVADVFGDIFPHTNAGLTPTCSDLDLTVRRLEGDLDSDCDVTVIDAQRIAFRYGSFFGQLLYDPHFDLEPFVAPDFDIDIKDLQFVFGRVGSTCAAPVPNSQNPVPANGVGQP